MNALIPYGEGKGRVIVYKTFAKDGAMEFGVLLPQHEAKEHELNRQALAAAKEFLIAIDGDPAWVKIEGCAFCHIDDVASYPNQLWHMPAFRAWILPIEGCPKPQAPTAP